MALIAVIDLGEVPAPEVSDEPAARPWPYGRWTLVAVAVSLALVTVGGSAPPQRPLPMAVLPAPAGSVVSVARDMLFVAAPDRFGNSWHVAAHRLIDLKQRWRVELPFDGRAYGFTAVGGTLALAGGQPRSGLSAVGLDAVTGAVRWRHDAAIEGPTPGGRLLLSSARGAPDAPPGVEPGATGETLRAVHADTGAVAWSLDIPAGATRSYRLDGEKLDLLAVVLPTGWVELRDVDTGTLLRSRRVGPPSAAPGANPYAELIGDLLVVRDASSTVAYGLDRLDLRWRLPVEAGHDEWATPCGNAICLLRQGGGGLAVVDPSTGRRTWSDRGLSMIQAEVDGYLIASREQRDGQSVVAVDPDTGRVRRELGTWHELRADSADGPIAAIRYELDRTLVARLDPARGTRILDVLHDIVWRGCQVQSDRLLCWRTDNTLGVWRLPG